VTGTRGRLWNGGRRVFKAKGTGHEVSIEKSVNTRRHQLFFQGLHFGKRNRAKRLLVIQYRKYLSNKGGIYEPDHSRHQIVLQGCHGVCQVLVHMEGDRVVRVAGDPDSPTSRGYICPKGQLAPKFSTIRIGSPIP